MEIPAFRSATVKSWLLNLCFKKRPVQIQTCNGKVNLIGQIQAVHNAHTHTHTHTPARVHTHTQAKALVITIE